MSNTETVYMTLEAAMAHTPVKTVFTVTIEHQMTPNTVCEHDTLEQATRCWDGLTYNVLDSTGGIEVTQWDSQGNQVRNGWILHVRPGYVYLNPNIKLA